ncbi:MAG: NAD(P)-dependent oxidoreductase [Anaerolineaceae bacterium]|nr:NAD(P)-dependent oxidoreductase [Anaerolineaceae bacterium]
MNYNLTVGYIGLGLMGKPMARNILKAGFDVVVFNRTREKCIDLINEGAHEGLSPADVAGRSDIVFTNLSDTPDVLEIVLGINGIIEGAHPNMIYVDNSTIKPAAAIKIAEKLKTKGVESIDAPVSGGEIGAINGTLTIMAGGPESALKIVMPVFKVIGTKITHVGASGAGQIAKAANQIMVGAQMVAMGELLIFAQKAGVDPRKVVEAISSGAAQCWTLDQKPSRLFVGNREPGFKAGLQAKDLRIVTETAKELIINLPMSAIVSQLFNQMIDMGLNDEDNSSVISVIEELNDIHLDET